jgi:hypothetical protein
VCWSWFATAQTLFSLMWDAAVCMISMPIESSEVMNYLIVGNISRKVVVDGFPVSNVVATDLHQGPVTESANSGART